MICDTRREKSPFDVFSQREVAHFFRVDSSTVKNWVEMGMPRDPASARRFRYDLSEITTWLVTEGPWAKRKSSSDASAVAPKPLDPAALAGIRIKEARASKAELELAEMERALIRVDVAKATLVLWSESIRRLSERLSRRFGAEAAIEVQDALEECRRVLEEL